mgnify:CR=1 FL=1
MENVNEEAPLDLPTEAEEDSKLRKPTTDDFRKLVLHTHNQEED